MKTCKNCGAQLDDQAKFCRYCGKSAEEENSQSFQNTGSMYGSHSTGNMYGSQNTGSMYGNQNAGNRYGNQGYGNNTYGTGYGGYQQPAATKTCGFSIASLVLSLIGIFLGYLGAASMAGQGILGSVGYWGSGYAGIMAFLAFVFFLPSILGILFGIAGIVKTGQPGVSGKGLAIAGLVVGIIFLLIWLFIGMAATSMVDSFYYSGW